MLDFRATTFLTLYEEMNYRKTAERLNMTQPGVTQHIHFLEGYYGVKLFEYDGRRLERTKEAEGLKRYFDSVRAEEAHVREGFEKKDGVRLTMGATKTVGEFVIPDTVLNYLKDPRNGLELVIDNTEVLLGLLEKGKLDFALVEGVFDKSKYGHRHFKNEAFVGICGKDHPFANKKVPIEGTFGQDIAVREPLSGTRRILENALHDRGYSLDCYRRCISVSNFSVICELVARGGAITFGYEPVSKSRGDLATFSLCDMDITGQFNFVYCSKYRAEEKISLMFDI